MNLSTLFVLVICITRAVFTEGGGNSKCGSSSLYECPSLTETCNETVYVNDCFECDSFFSTDSEHGVCFDRQLFNANSNPDPSYLWRDIVGTFVWFTAAAVAITCGIGGGGIYVPMGILLLNFAPKTASGLSQASIFGATLGGLLLNIQDTNPFTIKVQERKGPNEADIISFAPSTGATAPKSEEGAHYYERPLIDYDTALFLAPMAMAGGVLGVVIQRMLPNWLYLSFAAIILGGTAYKTYKQYLDTRKKESIGSQNEEKQQAQVPQVSPDQEPAPGKKPVLEQEQRQQASAAMTTNDDSSSCIVNVEPHRTVQENENSTCDASFCDKKAALRKTLLERHSRQYPVEKLLALLILWIGQVLLTFFKGGKGVDSIVGITCASYWYGILIVIDFLWTFGFASMYGYKAMKVAEEKLAAGYPFHPQDVMWDYPKVKFYAIFTFLAGTVAALVGISVGNFLGPLMIIKMGIHARVSSATTATMIVLTSSSVALLFVAAGQVPWQYALTFFSVCFCGALVGKTVIDGYVKRTGKTSVLVFFLALILAFGSLGCVAILFTQLHGAGWCLAGFNEFCTVPQGHHHEDICEADRLLFVTASEVPGLFGEL